MTTDAAFTGTTVEGRKLLRIEARNAEVPIERKPSWIRTTMKTGPEYTKIRNLVASEGESSALDVVTSVKSTPGSPTP
jgi:lipoyl synthase